MNANLPGLFGKAIQGAEFNLSQSNWLWYLRMRPQIKGIFQALHQTPDLCTSFDGFSLDWSCENKSPPWLHEDKDLRCPTRRELRSVQGIYCATETREDSRAFACVPDSHATADERFFARSLRDRQEGIPLGAHVKLKHYVPLEKDSCAANKSFEISKFKTSTSRVSASSKFPRARTCELVRALSRLYRSQILHVFPCLCVSTFVKTNATTVFSQRRAVLF